jgi:hypothetical protein
MDAIIAAAQQAEVQNARTLILEAINSGLITETQANLLTPEHIEEIGILETPQQVRDYVNEALVETPDARSARRAQEQATLQQLRENLRNEVQERANARAALINPVQPMGGSRRRRKQSRKSRKHRR